MAHPSADTLCMHQSVDSRKRASVPIMKFDLSVIEAKSKSGGGERMSQGLWKDALGVKVQGPLAALDYLVA